MAKKYNYNENYFEKIDTEEKAYWLGFIAADGSIVNNGSALEISLKQSDRNHLIKFANAIGETDRMVKDRNQKCSNGKYYPTSRISVCSSIMTNHLAKHGIVQNKGFNLVFPDFLKEELLRHYLRGYFDGDGSISTNGKNRNGSPKYALNLIATESFLEDFMTWLNHLGISKVKLQNKNKMKVWNKVGINQIRIILSYLYDNCTIYLDRKYNYARELLPS